MDEIDPDDNCENGMIKSIRTDTGLEIGCRIQWDTSVSLELSTVLPSTSMAPMFDGTQWAGTRLWRAAIVAVRYLELHAEEILKRPSGEPRTLLELGCGLGVPGMILHSKIGCPTVLTDKGGLLEQLQTNIHSNFDEAQNIYARNLDWNVGIDELIESLSGIATFDVVLNCDCIYEPLYGESWKPLIKCQEDLLRLNPSAVVITSCERRVADGVDHYLEAVNASSVIQRVERIDTKGIDCPKAIELYRFHG